MITLTFRTIVFKLVFALNNKSVAMCNRKDLFSSINPNCIPTTLRIYTLEPFGMWISSRQDIQIRKWLHGLLKKLLWRAAYAPGDGQTSPAYSSQPVQRMYINLLLSVNKPVLSYLLLCLLPHCHCFHINSDKEHFNDRRSTTSMPQLSKQEQYRLFTVLTRPLGMTVALKHSCIL